MALCPAQPQAFPERGVIEFSCAQAEQSMRTAAGVEKGVLNGRMSEQ